jgi:hypothetical protein
MRTLGLVIITLLLYVIEIVFWSIILSVVFFIGNLTVSWGLYAQALGLAIIGNMLINSWLYWYKQVEEAY